MTMWGLRVKAGLFSASADRGVASGHLCSDFVGLLAADGKDLGVDDVMRCGVYPAMRGVL